MSPQVWRTLLCILVDHNNALVWIVSSRLTISMSSSLFTELLVTVPRAPTTIGIIVSFMLLSFVNFLGGYRYLFFFRFQFYSVVSLESKIPNSTILFFVDYKFWRSGRDLLIRLFLKIPEEFACLILLDSCWVVHILVRMVKFKFPAQYPVDYLSHPIMFSLKLFLC